MPLMSAFDGEKELFCTNCLAGLEVCHCTWAAIRQLQKDVLDSEERIGRLNSFVCEQSYNQHSLDKKIESRLDEMEKRFSEFEKRWRQGAAERIGILGKALNYLSEENERLRKTPHKCPNGK